jgi:DNA-binding GntR family transcriptional regulator
MSKAAYDTLRDYIANGVLLPNERLVEEDLAGRLETSRGHVRAALVRLEQDGLVIREPNRGARVRVISLEEAVEILEVRAAVESLVAREAAVRCAPAEAKALREIVDLMQSTWRSGDLATYSTLNPRLHRKILDISGNQTAMKMLGTLQSQAVRFHYRTGMLPNRPLQSQSEHRAIVKAITGHDPDAAEKAMRTHLSHVVDALKAVATMSAGDGSALVPGPAKKKPTRAPAPSKARATPRRVKARS